MEKNLVKLFLFIIFLCFFVPDVLIAASDLQFTESRVEVREEKGAILLECVIANHGPDEAANIRIRVHVASGNADVSTQEYDLQPLSVNASRSERLEVLAGDTLFGTIQVEVFDLIQPDIKPSNNSLQLKYQMPGIETADLKISEVVLFSEQPIVDRALRFKVRIANSGPSAVGNTTLSADLTQFQKSLSYQEKKIGKVAADSEKEIKISMPLPVDGIPIQEGLLKVSIASEDSEIRDSDDANNVY
jgi:hypothetical protein